MIIASVFHDNLSIMENEYDYVLQKNYKSFPSDLYLNG